MVKKLNTYYTLYHSDICFTLTICSCQCPLTIHELVANSKTTIPNKKGRVKGFFKIFFVFCRKFF